MTHIENIPHILMNGITHKDSSNADPDYVAIGDVSLINTRAAKQINITNGNRSKPFETITLGDFIPFYFGVRMPMLYVMQHGGNCVERATPKEDIIYVVCNLKDIVESGVTYYFSDGHATDNLSLFYDSSKIYELPNIIDMQAIIARFWHDNLDIKRKKQAEFLAVDDIAPENICGFVCYNDNSKQRLIKMTGDSDKIKIFPQAYF
jgi:hypothetical protein